MKCVMKSDNKYRTVGSLTKAMDDLEPGMSVDCYEDDGTLQSSFGLVEMPDIGVAAPEPKTIKVVEDHFTWYGPTGIFGEVKQEAYLLGIEIQIDSYENETYGFLCFKSQWERVLFKASGPEKQFEEFKRSVTAIGNRYNERLRK